jgi:phosphomannomutase
LVTNADTSLIESSGLKIVLDPMYGAGCGYAHELFERMGCEVVAVHDRPIPDFRGLHPDAHEPWVDECEREVVASHADMGIVLDGACERFALIDERGRLVSQHDLAPMILEHIVRQRGKQGRVVGTVATSARISHQADSLGCDYTMVPVGIDSIYREFGEGDVILATDEGGSICVPSHVPMRDGIIGAVMLVEYAAALPSPISSLVNDITEQIGRLEYASRDVRLDAATAQRLRNILPGLSPEAAFGPLPSPVVRVSHVDGLRADLEDGSWLLLRPSRGGPTARTYAEAPTPALSRSLASRAAPSSLG